MCNGRISVYLYERLIPRHKRLKKKENRKRSRKFEQLIVYEQLFCTVPHTRRHTLPLLEILGVQHTLFEIFIFIDRSPREELFFCCFRVVLVVFELF